MAANCRGRCSHVARATGIGVSLAGVGFTGLGLWARREACRTLARERIADATGSGGDGAAVMSGAAARAMAELIRKNTLETTGGRTYAEIEPYVDAEGNPTSESERAAKDERTGHAIENPHHALWVQSTALQTALTQAYMAFRLAELTVALGVSFVAVGLGLAATGRR